MFAGAFPILKTSRLLLRALNEDDAGEIFFLRSDKEVLKYIHKAPAKTIEEALEFIRKTRQWRADGAGILWGLVPENENKIVGTICFWNVDAAKNQAEVGYTLHPSQHGKGLMQEALIAVLNYGVTDLGFTVVEAYTNVRNMASRKLLERNGFARDALLEQEKVGTEEPADATIYVYRP